MNRLPYPICLSFTIDYFPSSCFLKSYLLLIFIESSSDENALAIAITRLLALEQAIERRYLKHPLRNEWVTAALFHPALSKTFVTTSQIGHYWTGSDDKFYLCLHHFSKHCFGVISGNLYLKLLENVNRTVKYVFLPFKVFVHLTLKLPDFLSDFFLMSLAFETKH